MKVRRTFGFLAAAGVAAATLAAPAHSATVIKQPPDVYLSATAYSVRAYVDAGRYLSGPGVVDPDPIEVYQPTPVPAPLSPSVDAAVFNGPFGAYFAAASVQGVLAGYAVTQELPSPKI